MSLAKICLKQSNTVVTALIAKNRVYPVFEKLSSLLEMSLIEYKEFQHSIIDNLSSPSISFKDIDFLPPVSEGHFTIFCIGKNYLDHVNEVKGTGLGDTLPEHPIVFSKALSSISGPYAEIPFPSSTTTSQVDYEGELGLVIGKSGKNIAKEKAYEHIFGVTVVNDITARDKQKKHIQWMLGKSLDGFCPLGPSIMPLVDVQGKIDSEGLGIKTLVNGELRQNGNTKDLIFNIPTLIHEISQDITLQTGDIIATGTPSGVGAGFKPPKYLKKGDVVSVEIENIGKTENTFV